MVNEAYLNRLNAGFTESVFERTGLVRVKKTSQSAKYWSRRLSRRSVDGEVGHVDRFDPFGIGIDHQCADRERDAVGDSAFLGVQLDQPGLASERIGKRPLSELEQEQRQGTAKQRGIDEIVQ